LQDHECYFWCPAPLREGEQHQRKLKSDKYQPPAAWLLEFYESDSSVEADEGTDVEVGGDAGMGPDSGGTRKSWRKTRSTVVKQSVSTAAAAVSTVKAAEKKMKRKTSPLPAVEMPMILTPHSRKVKSEEEEEDEAIEEPPVVEDRSARRLESPATKRQRKLVQKMSEDALRWGLEVQLTTAATQAKMPASMRPRFFRSKPHVPAVTR
jgi:hypothetical protein